MRKISVVGLGKLGLCLAACFAYRGFKTIGVDVNKEVIDSINNRISPIIEPGLQELITDVGNKLEVTQSHKSAISETDITFIIVATPSNPDGNFSNKYVESALKSLAIAFKKINKKYHLFIISCTVMPTSTEERLIPIIEKYSKKKLNVDFGVCYIPDFVALGNVIKDFLNPDLVVIGESNKFAGNRAKSIYKQMCENNPSISRMSIISAEIAKVSLNAYITMKISFANMLGNICEKIPNSEVDLITKSIGADKRISPFYFHAGLSYGGTCFPRDTRAFIVFSEKFGYNAKLIKTIEKINEFQHRNLLEHVLTEASSINTKKIAILGLTFKPNTSVIIESPAIRLIEKLIEYNLEIIVYDKLAVNNVKAIFGDKILYASTIKDCFDYAPLCVVTIQEPEFKSIDENYITHNPTTIIDCWRILDPLKLGKGIRYVALGTVNKLSK